jgi:choline kinase
VKKSKLNYKVCILAAGAGSRMGNLSQYVNKAILPVNFKAAITHIIEKFPVDVEIVIAVGHKKETLIDYLAVAHPDRRFNFVEIKEYVGPGTGPGQSLLLCKQHLQCPFILFTADTIVLEEIPAPTRNWYGVAEVKTPEEYCTVKIKNNLVYQIDDKVKCNNKFAWIGLAGIKDYKIFFNELERNKDVIAGEIQVSNGFKNLIERQLAPVDFTWFDTGTLKKYIDTNTNLSGGNKGFDFSKTNEFLYFVGDRVIKYFADDDIVAKRCERSKLFGGLCPEIIDSRSHFYAYQKVDGQTLYSILNNKLLADFLKWAETYLWEKRTLDKQGQINFELTCQQFYFDKTINRLSVFYQKTGMSDEKNVVNGVKIPTLKTLFQQIDWSYLCRGIPARIHGDLQFDNILVSKDAKMARKQFVLLDWRQDFGGNVTTGDLYYDLAKMYGGMLMSYQLIKEGMFQFDMSGSEVFYKYHIKSDLLDAREEYERFLTKNGFDLNKIKIMTSLIFLNMSALHNNPFDLMLFFVGKKMLHSALEQSPSPIHASAKENAI